MPETGLPNHEAPAITGEQFLATQASPEFQELRSKLRRFVFPMTAFFLIWYATYVLLGASPTTSWRPRCSATSTSGF